MTIYMNTSEVVNNLALTELDAETESLREVTEDSFVIAVSSKRFTIKRYYLIGEMLYKKYITVRVTTGSFDYTARILVGSKEYPRYSDFNREIHKGVSYDTSNFKYLNALPVDVLVESNRISQTDCTLEIEIGAEDEWIHTE